MYSRQRRLWLGRTLVMDDSKDKQAQEAHNVGAVEDLKVVPPDPLSAGYP